MKVGDLVHYDERGWYVSAILRRAVEGGPLIELIDLCNPSPRDAEKRLVPASKLVAK